MIYCREFLNATIRVDQSTKVVFVVDGGSKFNR